MADVLPQIPSNFIQGPRNLQMPTIKRQNTRRFKKPSVNLTRRLKNAITTKIEMASPGVSVQYPNLAMIDAEPMFSGPLIEELHPEIIKTQESIQEAVERAQFYMQNYPKTFDQDIEPENMAECFGILYHRGNFGPPIAMDPVTNLQEKIWSSLMLTQENAPIYIMHLKGVKEITPDALIKYKELFKKQ